MNNSKKTENKKTFSVYKPDGRHFTDEFKTAVCTMRIASQDRNPDHPVSAQRIARFWQGLGYAEINQSKISRILRSCPAFRPNVHAYNAGAAGGQTTWEKYGNIPANSLSQPETTESPGVEEAHVEGTDPTCMSDAVDRLDVRLSEGGRRLTLSAAGYDVAITSPAAMLLSMAPSKDKKD